MSAPISPGAAHQEKSLARVRELGAKITKEIYSFPGGRRFELLDPVGNALAVWSE